VRRLIRTKPRKAAVVLTVAALVAVGAAFAWYAGYGSTTASASAGHAPLTISLAAGTVNNGDPIYPGDIVPVPVTVTNTSGHRAHVGSIRLASVDTGAVGCDPAWFTMPDEGVGETLNAGASILATGNLQFSDEQLDQGACSDASLTLHLETIPTP